MCETRCSALTCQKLIPGYWKIPLIVLCARPVGALQCVIRSSRIPRGQGTVREDALPGPAGSTH